MAPFLGRLKRRSEFLRVAATRQRWVTPGLILQAGRRKELEEQTGDEAQARVGFTVSRRVGNAVRRNRARRRLRAVVERVMPDLAESGYDYVIVGRANTVTRPFPALETDLRTALEHLQKRREKRRGDRR